VNVTVVEAIRTLKAAALRMDTNKCFMFETTSTSHEAY